MSTATDLSQWKAFIDTEGQIGWLSRTFIDQSGARIQMTVTRDGDDRATISAFILQSGAGAIEHVWRGYSDDSLESVQMAAIEGRLYELCQWHGFDYGDL